MYQQRWEDPEMGFVLDSYGNQTTPQMIGFLRELPIIGLDITISSVGDHLPSNPPPNNIILSANVLKAFLPIPLLDFHLSCPWGTKHLSWKANPQLFTKPSCRPRPFQRSRSRAYH